VQYLLEFWELDSVCHPYCSARFIDHLGAHLVQVGVMMKLWQSSQDA
jgi:hypothetical protein